MKTPKLHEPPVTQYPYNKNRVLIVDWASLSYHQMFSMQNKTNRTRLGILPEEDELIVWRTRMFNRMIEYIKLFNPLHIVLCLEGKNAWRKQLVRDFYNEHTRVYYDAQSYYVVSYNYAYRVTKVGEGFSTVRIPVKQYAMFESLKSKKLGELPMDKQDMLWNISTETGVPIIPSYKGKRKSAVWPFAIDKRKWMNYKDEFAQELAPVFRARAVKCDCAEGDDMIYASVQKFAGDADDVIILTRDSDMSQINHPKVKIFDHCSNTFTKCIDPKAYLDCKVLSGDTSDNIPGMAFVDKKTGAYTPTKANQIGQGDSITLLENCPNIYAVAKANGWGDQYMRNRTLIDLSMVPSHITDQINAELDKPEPELGTLEKSVEWGIPQSKIDYYQLLKNFGFYSVLPMETLDVDKFRGEIFLQEEEQAAAAELQLPAFGDKSMKDSVAEEFGSSVGLPSDIGDSWDPNNVLGLF